MTVPPRQAGPRAALRIRRHRHLTEAGMEGRSAADPGSRSSSTRPVGRGLSRFALAACGLAGAIAVPTPGAAQAAGDRQPRLSLWQGAFTMQPEGLLQLDLGTTFGGTGEGVPQGGVNPRRARIGVTGKILDDFEYNLFWDFGGRPGSRNALYEASLAWTGRPGLALRAGVFEPNFSLQLDRSAQDLLFFERAAIVDIAKQVAAGSARTGLQARAHGERWFASGAVTGGQTGPGTDSSQRGAVLRLAGLPVRREDLVLHLGASAAWSFRPERGAGEEGARGFAFSVAPELSLDRRDPPLGTGPITADSAQVAGAELGLSWRRLQLQGEWYRIGIDSGGSERRISGWYAQASWVLAGKPRSYEMDSATWGGPQPEGGFDPPAGQWGAVDVGLRFSSVDLNDRDLRGGRQRIWSAGLAWWPVERLALQAVYQYVQVTDRPDASDLSFQAVALRGQVRF